jgi:hypothetical protein
MIKASIDRLTTATVQNLSPVHDPSRLRTESLRHVQTKHQDLIMFNLWVSAFTPPRLLPRLLRLHSLQIPTERDVQAVEKLR